MKRGRLAAGQVHPFQRRPHGGSARVRSAMEAGGREKVAAGAALVLCLVGIAVLGSSGFPGLLLLLLAAGIGIALVMRV